jgi:heavy metal efflux system protein
MDVALDQRIIVLGFALMLVIAGIYSFHSLDIEAYPDPVQPRVEIITQPLGLSAEEVEKIATVPLEFGLAGLPQPYCNPYDLAVWVVRCEVVFRLG